MKPTTTPISRTQHSFVVIAACAAIAQLLGAQSRPTSSPAADEALQELQQQPAAEEEEKSGRLQELIENMMCRKFSRLKVSGYLLQGFTANPDSPKDRQNFGRLFDDRSNGYRLNQVMVTLEQQVDSKRCLDWGFKAQFGFGSDARFTHLTGTLDNVTDATIEPEVNELNATLHWHAGIDWDLKVGVYPSLCGLESIDPTGNVLYSHTYIFNYGVPFKHTGAMLFGTVCPGIQLMVGLDRGINIGLDDNNDAISWQAGVIGKAFDDALAFNLVAHYGAENPSSLGAVPGVDPDHDKRFIIDLSTIWTVNDRWKLMADMNYGHDEAPLGIGGTSPEWYGAAGYIVYSCTKKLDFVLRGEVFRDNNGFAVAQFAQNDDLLDIENGIFTNLDPRSVGGGATTYYGITLGTNFRPWDWFLLQAEVRYDWAGSTTPFDDSSSDHQLTFAIATLFTF